ncbi:uncharacterized protein TNIN_120761 [Trichonephila inaurata madagascariensis]|uniref:Uncharacterized protein n=1 Tax=Trichonephila inaurata madagascariensis TaxID=2747483 RepID=A0A8X6Y1L7_9ARAC|nr:uncharacterized protein TNIN_120761 [Trichonephila inaurata madagascariensis]
MCRLNKINTTMGLEKLKLIAKKELHLRKAEKALNLLNKDNASSRMPSSGTCTINMDMQQVIFTLTLTHSSMFYSRQLSNFNLCIYNGDTSTSFMCLWHEGMAGQEWNEIASCLLKVITSNLTPKRNLTVWCGNCSGKYDDLIIMIYAVAKNILDFIEFKFLVSGHSYIPYDREFNIIEKKRIYKPMVPVEIAKMIAETRHVQPFNVVMMKEVFYDISAQCDTFLNTLPIKISTSFWIKISREPICLIYKLRRPSVTWNPKRSITSLKEESLSMTSPVFTLYRHLEKGQSLVILKKRLFVYVGIYGYKIPCILSSTLYIIKLI